MVQTIDHLTKVRAILLKELASAENENDCLETAKRILDIDEALSTIRTVEVLDKTFKNSY